METIMVKVAGNIRCYNTSLVRNFIIKKVIYIVVVKTNLQAHNVFSHRFKGLLKNKATTRATCS